MLAAGFLLMACGVWPYCGVPAVQLPAVKNGIKVHAV